MSVDIVISKSGNVMLASNEPFPDDIVRVEFYMDTKLLVLGFDDPSAEGMLLNMEVHDSMVKPLSEAASVYVVYMEDNSPVVGYDVPLVQVGN